MMSPVSSIRRASTGPEPVEEHVQAAQARAEEPGGGHADLRVAGDHGDVGHQRHLEPAAERVATDLADGDLRKAHEVVVEAKGLAVHSESATLAGPALRGLLAGAVFCSLAVPPVRVVHVRTGREDALRPAQHHHGMSSSSATTSRYRDPRVAHRRVIRVALLGIVERDRRDSSIGIDLEQHAIVGSRHRVVLVSRAVSIDG